MKDPFDKMATKADIANHHRCYNCEELEAELERVKLELAKTQRTLAEKQDGILKFAADVNLLEVSSRHLLE